MTSDTVQAVPQQRQRVAVFASYSSDGFLPPQVVPYLKGLKPFVSAIVVVCDNELAPGERQKLSALASHVIAARHGEYDFGSYKRGFAWAQANGLLEDADDLILCNDSCFGPVGSFGPMFAEMDARNLDFWGATDSHEFKYHLQSYWVVLSRYVFTSFAFSRFLASVTKETSVQNVIMKYELGLTTALLEDGYEAGTFVENRLTRVHENDPTYDDVTTFPLYTLERGLPLVKVKALRFTAANHDGQNRLLAWLKANAPSLYQVTISDFLVQRFEDADEIRFSLIMATKDRAWCISRAIESVLAQSHRSFELIIVDDGSADGTCEMVHAVYPDEIAQSRIRYVRLPESTGVCNARNIGLSHARNDWIGYVDSDNVLRDNYLTMMANSIIEKPGCEAAYGRIIGSTRGTVVGAPFCRKKLLAANFIDLGVFVHRRDLVARHGGFDPNLKRLVDWDLILRYTAGRDPVHVPTVFLEYDDDPNPDRISVRESLVSARVAVHAKHAVRPTVTTAILSYNHQAFLVEAIESALAQTGDFTHEILLSDDGSTDGTARIIAAYARQYPNRIRDISRGRNFGISDNYRHCFQEAAGRYVAVLEGDDYWTDGQKNHHQAQFLERQPDAAMVFSRISVLNMSDGKRRLLKRQQGLERLLSGADVAHQEHLNLVVNLSSAMFRRDLMRSMPSSIYEPRLSEISLSFYFDRMGKLGFIDKVMGVYRQNEDSVWTGASRKSQLRQAIAIRERALSISKAKYRPQIEKQLMRKRLQLAELERTEGMIAA